MTSGVNGGNGNPPPPNVLGAFQWKCSVEQRKPLYQLCNIGLVWQEDMFASLGGGNGVTISGGHLLTSSHTSPMLCCSFCLSWHSDSEIQGHGFSPPWTEGIDDLLHLDQKPFFTLGVYYMLLLVQNEQLQDLQPFLQVSILGPLITFTSNYHSCPRPSVWNEASHTRQPDCRHHFFIEGTQHSAQMEAQHLAEMGSPGPLILLVPDEFPKWRRASKEHTNL